MANYGQAKVQAAPPETRTDNSKIIKNMLVCIPCICIAPVYAAMYFNLWMLLISTTMAIWHGLGITVVYHRLLTHKAFVTPKWLEYLGAFLTVFAHQGTPIEWVSAL